MTDRFKQLLRIGDEVAFNPPYYKGLIIGVVTKFTTKMVEVEYERWAGQPQSKTKTKVFPWDTVKKPAHIWPLTQTATPDSVNT